MVRKVFGAIYVVSDEILTDIGTNSRNLNYRAADGGDGDGRSRT
jgi:hypothetical protein